MPISLSGSQSGSSFSLPRLLANLNAPDRGGSSPNDLPSLSVPGAAAQILRPGLNWGGPGSVVSYAFRATAPETMPGTAVGFSNFTQVQIQATFLALQTWSDLALITFQRVGVGDTGPAAYSDDATILFSNYASGQGGQAAFAMFPGDAGSGAQDGDAWFNINDPTNVNPLTNIYGRLTLVHEIGHALGLHHPGEYNAEEGVSLTYGNAAEYFEDSNQFTVMSYFSESNTGGDFGGYYPVGPMLDDIAAIQDVYGVNWSTRAGDTTYGFDSNSGVDFYTQTAQTIPPIFSVWDGGGFDTLDFSGYAVAQTIDLRPGYFSDVGGFTGNVSIALGAVIERAIGGRGGDIMTASANITASDRPNLIKAIDTGNDTIGRAYDLDGAFDLSRSDTITLATTIPHTTVRAVASGSLEYYAVTVAAGATIILDLDGVAEDVDSAVGLLRADGSVVTANDDGHADAGSSSRADGYLAYTFAEGGVYYIIVGAASETGDSAPLPAGASYVLNVSLTSADVYVTGATGSTLEGRGGDDLLNGSMADDSLLGGIGDDFLIGGEGDDLLDGGSGVDRVDYSDATDAVSVNLGAAGPQDTGAAGLDTLVSIENVTGSAFDDRIVGRNSANVVNAGDGDDEVLGMGGDDLLGGGEGDDILRGGTGNDLLDGGAGNDAANYGDATTGVTVDLAQTSPQDTSGAGIDTLISIENLYGSAFGDVLSGDAGSNTLDGFLGDDILDGRGGADMLIGWSGNDTYYVDDTGDVVVEAANRGYDTVYASTSYTLERSASIESLRAASGTAAINLTGNVLGNELRGNAGDNVLNGGLGADVLIGGGGVDTFLFARVAESPSGGADLIVDLGDDDFIDLSRIDADVTFGGRQSFSLVAGFTNQAGQLTLTYDAGTGETLLAGDTNGDGIADFGVRLSGDHSDFTQFIFGGGG